MVGFGELAGEGLGDVKGGDQFRSLPDFDSCKKVFINKRRGDVGDRCLLLSFFCNCFF